MILVLDALQALECSGCGELVEIDRAISEDTEVRMRWIEYVTGQHAACGGDEDEVAAQTGRQKKLHRYRAMRGQL